MDYDARFPENIQYAFSRVKTKEENIISLLKKTISPSFYIHIQYIRNTILSEIQFNLFQRKLLNPLQSHYNKSLHLLFKIKKGLKRKLHKFHNNFPDFQAELIRYFLLIQFSFVV